MPLFAAETDFGDDYHMLIDAVGEYARQELFPLDRRWDEGQSSVYEVLPRLGGMGLLSLCVSQEWGGVGCPHRVYAAIIHELARWSPSVAVTVAVHTMVGKILANFAQEPHRQQWLQGWSDPAHFSAFALSEANAGSDAAAVATSIVEADGGYCLNGEKMWISNGMHARWFLTLGRLRGVPEDESLCALLVDGESPGVERTEIRGKMGLRGSETAVIHFQDVPVAADHLIGLRGKGLQVCLSSLNEGRIGIAAQASGIAESCLEEMVSYARQREQFGQPIGKFQAIGNMIADSAVELEAAKALIRRAAGEVEAGDVPPMTSSMAKLYATEAANRIAYRAVQIHGGMGFVHECRVEQLYRDVRVTTLYEGTSEIQRHVIARELAGEP